MQDDATLDERIRRKAYELWQQEGCPEGRELDHWDKARILVAIEDDRTSLIPVTPERPEEAEIQQNLGEFPAALTDEGDRQQMPSREAEKSIVERAPARPPAKPRRKR